jgi:hypothetical protein
LGVETAHDEMSGKKGEDQHKGYDNPIAPISGDVGIEQAHDALACADARPFFASV